MWQLAALTAACALLTSCAELVMMEPAADLAAVQAVLNPETVRKLHELGYSDFDIEWRTRSVLRPAGSVASESLEHFRESIRKAISPKGNSAASYAKLERIGIERRVIVGDRIGGHTYDEQLARHVAQNGRTYEQTCANVDRARESRRLEIEEAARTAPMRKRAQAAINQNMNMQTTGNPYNGPFNPNGF